MRIAIMVVMNVKKVIKVHFKTLANFMRIIKIVRRKDFGWLFQPLTAIAVALRKLSQRIFSVLMSPFYPLLGLGLVSKLQHKTT